MTPHNRRRSDRPRSRAARVTGVLVVLAAVLSVGIIGGQIVVSAGHVDEATTKATRAAVTVDDLAALQRLIILRGNRAIRRLCDRVNRLSRAAIRISQRGDKSLAGLLADGTITAARYRNLLADSRRARSDIRGLTCSKITL